MPKMTPVPPSILRALSSALGSPIDPSKATLSSSLGGSGFTTTGYLTVFIRSRHRTNGGQDDADEEEEEEPLKFFVKTSSNGIAAREMFRGEYESLNAIADASESGDDGKSAGAFCPRGLAWGCLSDELSASGSSSAAREGRGDVSGSACESGVQKDWFLITEFVDLGGRGRGGRSFSLAKRLGKLHSIPAPCPPPSKGTGSTVATTTTDSATTANKRMFGFPVPTFCGDTKQPNRFRESWADFYAEERLLTVLKTSEARNGKDPALRQLVEMTAHTVVPRLLGDEHLGYDHEGRGEGIVPVVVHGDLWSGNAGYGRVFRNGRQAGSRPRDGSTGDGHKAQEEEDGVGAVVYDPSACYAHSEYELGIMKMFGGFGRDFFDEYHRIVPKTEPIGEYEDRLKLYELYVYTQSLPVILLLERELLTSHEQIPPSQPPRHLRGRVSLRRSVHHAESDSEVWPVITSSLLYILLAKSGRFSLYILSPCRLRSTVSSII